MNICVNSRGLTEYQRARIEKYFRDNFEFEGKYPELVWRQDDSEFILLGYPYGSEDESGRDRRAEDLNSIMYRVHENELLEIAGRNIWNLFNDWYRTQTA